MSFEAPQLSPTAAFSMSQTQARRLWQPTEIQAVGAFLMRNGFTKFYVDSNGFLRSGKLESDPWATTKYLTLNITVNWISGRSATLSAIVDAFYGDLTGSSTYPGGGTTATNYGIQGLLFNNCQVLSTFNTGSYLYINPHSGDVDPKTRPDVITIAAGGLSATCTWGASACVLTATLGTAQTLSQDVELCSNMLQYVTLADSIAAPSKTYSCNFLDAGGLLSSNVTTALRFPSQFSSAPSGAAGVNAILIIPQRGAANGVQFWTIGFFGGLWQFGNAPESSFLQEFDAGGINYGVRWIFARNIFAYGIDQGVLSPLISDASGASYSGSLQTFISNNVTCVKSAINAKNKLDDGVAKEVNLTDGTQSNVAFSLSPAINSRGLYILDPVPLMTTPPAGYTVDPTGGTFTVVTQIPFANGGPYGAIVWPYLTSGLNLSTAQSGADSQMTADSNYTV